MLATTQTSTTQTFFAAGMADGLNQMRAGRVAQVMEDFRSLQHHIAQVKAVPIEKEKNGEGYRLLRECSQEGRQVLKAPFSASSEPPDGDSKEEESQLKQILLDASCRRFMAQRIYLRATAAMRWINARNAILQDGDETSANSPALQVVNSTLRTELSTITDSKVLGDLKLADEQQGRWIDEDPDLPTMLRFIASKQQQDSS